jgi:hypothetical protein
VINVEILVEFPTRVWRYIILCLENIVIDFPQEIKNDVIFQSYRLEFDLVDDPLVVFDEIVISPFLRWV